VSKTLLIIDDSKKDRELMRLFLKPLEYPEIFEAETGEQGVMVSTQHKPDIIILDTILPDIDGFETCRRIRAIDGLKSKIVMCTGDIDAINALKARQSGADEYCVKTPNFDALLERIHKGH
jgi:DNA-binding response OmpR family regulator